MFKGQISNQTGPSVAVDFAALLEDVSSMRMSWWVTRIRKWPWLYVKLTPWILPRCYRLSSEAEIAALSLFQAGVRIVVLVRLPYTLGMQKAVETLLTEYPTNRIHLAHNVGAPMPDQGRAISAACRALMCIRFFTKDAALASTMSSSLVKLVDTWLDDRLLS